MRSVQKYIVKVDTPREYQYAPAVSIPVQVLAVSKRLLSSTELRWRSLHRAEKGRGGRTYQER